MATQNQRIFSFTLGPFQATVFPLPDPIRGRVGYTVDLYHAGTSFNYPRFICTGEEVEALSRLSSAAGSLVRDYLAEGKTFAEWCAAYGLSPSDPELPS